MSTDHRSQVEELLADYRRSRERLATMQQELTAITGTARSEDGAVRVTVGPQGVLRDLVIDDDAYRRQRPDQLAATIVRLTGEAARSAALRAQELLAPVLPAGADPAAIFEGRADLDPQGPPVPAPPDAGSPSGSNETRPADDTADDDDLADEGSWLQDSATPRR